MTFSLSLMLILGLIANRLFEMLRLPGLLGMLLSGYVIQADWNASRSIT